MPGYLKQATAAQSRALGPFVSDTDFKTVQTGLTIANTDIKLVVNGGASANKNSGGGTHRVNGVYGVTFDATDTATVGEMEVSVSVAGALVVFDKFFVLEEAIYDALFAASSNGFAGAAGSSTVVFSNTSIATVTTVTNQLTAAAIATGVWQDSTAGDFTVASSIGKSLYISNVAPGGSGGHMISGSNAGTTTLAAFTVTGATTLTGNVVLSDGLTISAPSTLNRAGIDVTGNGTGAAMKLAAGATGKGIAITTTAGDGLSILPTAGSAIVATGNGTSKHGIIATGGTAGTSDGATFVAGTGGVDFRANQTGNLVGTVSTLTTYTGNTPQTGDAFARIGAAGAGLTAIPWNASWDAEVQSEVDDALVAQRLDELLNADSDIDGVAPPTVGSVFHELMTKTAGSFTYDQTTDSLEAIRDRGDSAWITATGFSTHSAADVWAVGTRVLTAATNITLAIADQVWEETLADHTGTVGSTAEALNAAGAAGDPWATALPGAYGAGSAGKIIGDNINATISSRASQASLDTVDGIVDSILLDTAEIGAAGAGLTVLATAVNLATVDTVVDGIKLKTDQLTFTVANQVDANAESMNATTILGTGAAGDLWRG